MGFKVEQEASFPRIKYPFFEKIVIPVCGKIRKESLVRGSRLVYDLFEKSKSRNTRTKNHNNMGMTE